jgi:hypothetical protein
VITNVSLDTTRADLSKSKTGDQMRILFSRRWQAWIKLPEYEIASVNDALNECTVVI